METFNTIGGCPALDEYARDLENKKIEILKLKEQNPLCPEENYHLADNQVGPNTPSENQTISPPSTTQQAPTIISDSPTAEEEVHSNQNALIGIAQAGKPDHFW